jgi:GT2 family glycosyltransferase
LKKLLGKNRNTGSGATADGNINRNTKMNKTAVVILNWNGLDYLKKFLGIVVINSLNPETGIFIADNGSTDGSADWILNNFPDVKLIRLDKNYGFAGGYNLALQEIDAKYFILLNSDIEVTPGWIDPMVQFMDKNPDVASCQPKILSWHLKDCFEYAGAAGGYIDKYGYSFCRGRIFNAVEKDSGQYDSNIDIFWSSGACMIVRSDAWVRCNGFDSDFFAHMEEIDLCWRFHIAGYRVCYIYESKVYHIGGGALPYDSPYKTYLNFRNNLFLLHKNLTDNKFHTVMFIRRLLDGFAAILFLFEGKFSNIRSVWRAHLHYYQSLKNLDEKRKKIRDLAINQTINTIMNKSIVFEFYIKRKKTFSSLMKLN